MTKPDYSKLQQSAWLAQDDGSFQRFKDLVSEEVDLTDWPLATSVHSNILVYDGDMVRDAAADPIKTRALKAEWAVAFAQGPGVIAIKQAVTDVAVIDVATQMFEKMILDEKEAAVKTGSGEDHFAKPGANDRIWNSLEKHCLADPENFARYYGNVTLSLACQAWLGDGYQMTAQVNRVNPGGEAQIAHRDYHLGFMPASRMVKYPAHAHNLSPYLTLQGAVAHTDMPLETGPTLCLPFSQKFTEGYFAFGREEFQTYFNEHRSQLALSKGDAMFFNPAVMHAAGTNRTKDAFRTANLLQISSAFGQAMEVIDRASMIVALYPYLARAKKNGSMSYAEIRCAIAASADGYAFPTSLDTDPPIGGLSPTTQNDLISDALEAGLSAREFEAALNTQMIRRRGGLKV